MAPADETPAPPPFLDPRLTDLLIWIARLVLFLLALYVIGLLLPVLLGLARALSPFLIGLVLAYVLDPIVTLVQRRLGLGRVGGLAVLGILLLLIAAIVLAVVIPIVVVQLLALIQGLQDFFTTGLPQLLERLEIRGSEEMLQRLMEAVSTWRETALQALSLAGSVVMGTVSTLGAVVAGLVTAAFVAVIGFYLLLEFDAVRPIVAIFIPPAHGERFWRVWGAIDENLAGFLRGQLLVCLCVGSLITVGLLIVGPRECALLIGLLAGTVNFVPYLGPAVGAAPAVLWALLAPGFETMGDRAFQLGLILLVFGGTQLIDGYFLTPKIIGTRAHMHPLLVMLALALGAQGGIGGMIIAVPAMIVAKALFAEFVWRPLCARRGAESG